MEPSTFERGVELFDRGEFYEAHEVLEDVWRVTGGADKLFLQGLVQLAVGLHHYSTGNLMGARSVLARGARNLAPYPEVHRGVRLDEVRHTVKQWCAALACGERPPPPPRLGPRPDDRIGPPMAKPATANPLPERPRLQVPLLDLKRQYVQLRDEIQTAVARVCESQRFILGEEVAALEREIAVFTGARAAVTCASGTDALWLALDCAGVGPGDEVITTPFSFFATVSSILRAGARPVLLDIDPATLNLDAKLVERRMRERYSARLRAVMVVHLFGQCADMDAFDRLAAEYKTSIVEDAAQAFGANWRGRRAGSLGVTAAFSFYPTKNLSAYGDGGCLTLADERRAERARRLRNHGSAQRYLHEEVGWNSRLDEMQAAILRVKLRHVERWNATRQELARDYEGLFTAAGLASERGSPSPLTLPRALPEAGHVFHQYVIRANRRDQLRQFLTERGIGTEIYYPVPLHMQPALRFLGYAEGDLPEAERAAREVLALPIFPELTGEEQAYVVNTIADFYS
jgi:dTDP-4-amino-4,6-dideoxygalactose transaminase